MNSKNRFGTAVLVLVAALCGVIGLAVLPASAKPIKDPYGCTTKDLNTLGAKKCLKKGDDDIMAGRKDHHVVVCTISGIYCCVEKADGSKTGCEKAQAVATPGGVRSPQGVLQPVSPGRSPVAPGQSPAAPIQK